MDKYLQNMKLLHILLISCLNLKDLLASICLKKDDVAFQIKGFLDKRIEGCGIQQVPQHLHYTFTFNFNVQNRCVSPAEQMPVCQVPQHHRHQTLASLVRVWHRPHRVAGVRTGVHAMSGYDPWSMAGCPGVQPAGGLGGAGGGAAGGGLHLPGLGRLRAGSLGQPHPRPG